MRLRSASNWRRSKYALSPQGSFELTPVASTDLNWPSDTALCPVIFSALTSTPLPSSLHAPAKHTDKIRMDNAARRDMRNEAIEPENKKAGERFPRNVSGLQLLGSAVTRA